MSSVAEIESAIEALTPDEKREVFDFLSTTMETGEEATFPDLKGLLLGMPDVGEDADFARPNEMPRDHDLS